jgi:hypothetical protein
MFTRMNALRALALATVTCAAGCTSGGQSPTQPVSPSASGQATETTAKSVTPSITRTVPPEQRQSLAAIPPDRLCDLVPASELGSLAFPVGPGTVADLGMRPATRGCRYDQLGGPRSVLIGVQPQGYGGLGLVQVALGATRGSETQHANDCTVLADVRGATLQVVVAGNGTDSSQCDQAQAVAQYALSALVS